MSDYSAYECLEIKGDERVVTITHNCPDRPNKKGMSQNSYHGRNTHDHWLFH